MDSNYVLIQRFKLVNFQESFPKVYQSREKTYNANDHINSLIQSGRSLLT